ncbi:MAG TPA: DUF6491 family protein [Vitreimonas sp.]|uniref:DUF6491 family protein n=1 Tax=Vitreimonas sp. TaxID=3069702 RepID=UPI002D5E941B|nr:DUF6491 family protein [Vitreimonas sp.]HYD86563.1 DUF6491 family protein [Vitreimonas sp.]
MLRKLAAAAALLALGACASATTDTASSAEGRDCFRTVDVRGYGVVDEHRIRARVSTSREYYLTIAQNTRDLDWNHAIAIRSTTSFICVGNGAGVQVLGGDPAIPYQVTRIERAPDDTPPGS